ncbi:MAG: cupredoxin domain-containing protein, partial [Nitrosomonas sp.]
MNKRLMIIPFVTLILLSANSYSATEAIDIGHPGDVGKVTRTIDLSQVDNRFLPAELTVEEGETIRFEIKNNGSSRHEMLIGSMADLKEVAGMR